MKKILLTIAIISIGLSERNLRDLQLIHQNGNRDCDSGYIQECTGDGDCCPESWLGDGYCDNGDDCNLECYYYDEGDCGIPGCGAGYVSDCSGDGDCCDAWWLDDGICDGEDQARGCDLTCYFHDGWDCYGDSGGNTLTIDCYACWGYGIYAGLPCFDLINLDEWLNGNMNCYVCDELFDCNGYCGGDGVDDGIMPSYECCDDSLACYPSECDVAFDECYVCGGTGVEEDGCCPENSQAYEGQADCTGECGGSAELDACGICSGPGIPEGECDCYGNTLDSCGICGGDNLADTGCGCFEPPPDICGECAGDGLDCNNNSIDDACEDEFNLGALSGDANGDGILNVVDMVIFIGMILNN